jgi:hypothetical protein
MALTQVASGLIASVAGSTITGSQSIPKSTLPTGSVLQVVQITNATAVSTTSTTYINTNLAASITPSSSTSKILITITSSYDIGSSGESFGVQLVRNGSSIYLPQGADGAGPLYAYFNSSNELIGPINFSYLDSPSTTSSTTYTLQCRKRNGANSVTIPTAQASTGTAVIILMEISA